MAIFGYKTKEEKRIELEAQQRREKQLAVYNALIHGLNEIDKAEVDRVILTLYESQPAEDATSRWLTIGKDNAYYPFEFLTEPEQKMVLEGKHYTVVSLVRKNVGGFMEYPDRGVELCFRTRINPILSRLNPESNLLYVTKTGIYNGPQIREFADSVIDSGWTAEMINQVVTAGIQQPRKVVEAKGIDLHGFRELSDSLEM